MGLMMQILQYLKDPKLWELWYIFLMMGNAGFISSTLESIILHGCECAGGIHMHLSCCSVTLAFFIWGSFQSIQDSVPLSIVGSARQGTWNATLDPKPLNP